MFPSIAFKVVRKVIGFYTKKLNEEELEKIKIFLEMIKFIMGNQIFSFEDKYYKCRQERNHKERPLTIRGYKSVWLTDLVAGFILDNTPRNLQR